ncbi:MAG: Rho termination factor N-terminal domain-containing protein, partial [Synergistaceae bacterium]|nr:Rho termination factor N-terminal domain-containing protein [Synergistaceae bacterium]
MSTLKELRKEASELGIKRYSRMTKSQLEAEIAKITDNSQHEKPQTCSIPDTTNITPADDTQEDTQNAQPENVKFVVGKTYLCGLSVWGLDWDGYKATYYSYKITITGRKGNYLTIHDELYGE